MFRSKQDSFRSQTETQQVFYSNMVSKIEYETSIMDLIVRNSWKSNMILVLRNQLAVPSAEPY